VGRGCFAHFHFSTQVETLQRLTCLSGWLTVDQAGGVAIGILGPIFFDYSIIIPSNSMPVSAALVEDMIDLWMPDTAYVAPSILQDISQHSGGLKKLSQLEAVGFTGGALSHHTGNQVAAQTMLINTCGCGRPRSNTMTAWTGSITTSTLK
jgi:hypothetical protein